METQLTWDEYRILARRTQDHTLSPREKLAHAVLGLCSELHEADLESSALVFGNPEFSIVIKQRLAFEIGDCYWMIAELCDCLDGESNGALFSLPYEARNSRTRVSSVGASALRSATAHLCNVAQKAFQGHEADNSFVVKPALSVIARHLESLAEKSDFDTPVILQMNIEKLKKRYPDGFSAECSVNREEGV